MKPVARPVLVAACCLALARPAVATAPDAQISAPPNTTPDKSESEATQMKAELQRAKDAVNSARKPEDLDPVLFDLQKYQNNGFEFGAPSTVSPGNQELLQQLLSALEFTKQWQNYLSHLASGQTDQARNDLMAMSQNNNGPSLIPRSRLLALMNGQQAPAVANTPAAAAPEVPEAQKIIDDIQTLDDLPTALAKLNALAQQDGIARESAQHLAPMVEVYMDLKNGLPTSVNIDFMGGLTGAGVSIKANSLLLKFVLQHYFDTYKGAPPTDDETPAAYATRVKNDALAGQDWALLKKALTAHSYLYRNVASMGGIPDNEGDGLNKVITGINQNEAGQYSLAVQSFQDALKAGSLDIPAKFVGEQLATIKRDHPDEYNSGMEAFLAPAMPQQPYYQGMTPAMVNAMIAARRYRPGLPFNLQAMPGQASQLSPSLSIPGAKSPTPPAATAPASTNAPAPAAAH